MQYMLLIVNPKDGPPREAVGMDQMSQFAGEIGRAGKMRGGAPLHPEAAGARVRVRDGRAAVIDGPFAESKEVVSGYFAIEAADRAEAIEIAKRCPAARSGAVQVHAAPDRDVAKAAQDTSFLLLLHMSPDDRDPDLVKYKEMTAFDDALKREGAFVECAQLPLDPPAARVESHGGKAVVTDGPFAESKEIAGGYFIVSAPTRAAAIELAKRCPHARWGAIEVREIMRIGPI